MMASDSSQTPSSRLDDATLEALRAALSQYLIDDTSSNQLRDVLMRVATEARERGILPEHVLIALKNVIYNRSFPAIAVHPTEWASGTRLHEKISTWCIEEFFSERTA